MAFAQWIAEGRLRDAGSWLAKTYTAEVLSLCRSFVGDSAQAEDLAQDTFGRAFGGLADFRSEASPRTWLLKIARNRCIDHLRANGRKLSLISDDPDLVEHAAAETPLPTDLSNRRNEVERALSILAEGERALVVLRFAHGLSYDELAQSFGIRSGTARMRVSRALAKMRDELSGVDAAPRPAAAMAPPPAPRGLPAPASIAPPGFAPPPRQRAKRGRLPAPSASAPPPVAAPSAHSLTGYFASLHHESVQLQRQLESLARETLPG